MPLATPLLTAALLVVTFWVQLASGLNPDVSWLLTVGERMLDGQRLYVDILELNPPMSALLYLPMVAFGQFFVLPPEPLVVGVILLLTLACLWFSLDLLQRGGIVTDTRVWWLVGLVALTTFPGSNFGEREHIAVILLLPALAVAALRSRGEVVSLPVSVLAGVAAGLVMTIKPHFALPILLVALHGAVVARSWRPIFNLTYIVAGLVLMGYGFVVWAVFPEFLTDMLPLASEAYIGDRRAFLPLTFGFPTFPFWLMLAGLLLVYRRDALTAPNVQLLVAGIGFFLVFLVQGKGFAYHLLPGNVLLAMVLVQCFIARNGQGWQGPFFTGLAVLGLSFPSLIAARGEASRNEVLATLRTYGPGLKIANMTAHLDVASPLHRQLGAELVNSGPCLWITLGAVRRALYTEDATVKARMVELELFERDRLRDDLVANPPDIILAGADRFDWIAWAQQDQGLSALLDDYDLMDTLGTEAMPIQIWRRAQ